MDARESDGAMDSTPLIQYPEARCAFCGHPHGHWNWCYFWTPVRTTHDAHNTAPRCGVRSASGGMTSRQCTQTTI